MKIKHRGRVLARLYRPSDAYPNYRVAWQSGGRRLMKGFHRYSEAKRHADGLVKLLAKGDRSTELTAGQANDALAALERLEAHRQSTGRKFSLLSAVSQFCEADGRLNGKLLSDAVSGFISTVAVVQRKPLTEAVAEFIEGRKHLTETKDGKRSKHSPVYEYHVSFWLNEFAKTLTGHAACDVTKEGIDAYFAALKDLSAKSRNDRRAVLKMFLKWAAAKDYVAQNHRLFEAPHFKAEDVEIADIGYYRPNELRAMLERASRTPALGTNGKPVEEDFRGIFPVIALSGLAGLRIEECLRLEWADVWRVSGKIEIGHRVAKGRQRRLVTMNGSLAKWLEDYRKASGRVCALKPMQFNRLFVKLRDELKLKPRKNGLRHGFVTYHYAFYQNENLTAAESGNSPQMIHQHYRALATKDEAKKYFAVAPSKAANVVQLNQAKA